MSKVATLRLTIHYNEYAAPTVTAINPSSGIDTEETPVTITGTGYATDSPDTVTGTIGGRAITNLQVVNDTTLTGVAPRGVASAAGDDVVITAIYNTTGETSGTGTGLFRYFTTPSADPITRKRGRSRRGKLRR